MSISTKGINRAKLYKSPKVALKIAKRNNMHVRRVDKVIEKGKLLYTATFYQIIE